MKYISITILVASTLTLSACAEVSQESIKQDVLVASLNLTPDEQNIWDTLTEAQRQRAITFIQNGGTLIASLGDK